SIATYVHPTAGSQLSTVHGSPSSQFLVRQNASQQASAVAGSHVSGNSVTWFPHTGQASRQPGGSLGPVQNGARRTSPPASDGENGPAGGAGAPDGMTTKFRLAAMVPVVATCAPESTTRAVCALN